MGISSYPLLVSLKGIVRESQEMNKVLESHHHQYRRRNQRIIMRNKRSRRVLMKSRARPEGSRRRTRTTNGSVHRRVRTLKKLIPNSESMGMEGLFRETADYILNLQMRVKVMQIMVKVLTGSNDDDN